MSERESRPPAPTLAFRLAHPTRHGFNWRLQHYSAEVRYTLPPATRRVEVTWSRPGGIHGTDVLSFHSEATRRTKP